MMRRLKDVHRGRRQAEDMDVSSTSGGPLRTGLTTIPFSKKDLVVPG
jgi:hypothetical protein